MARLTIGYALLIAASALAATWWGMRAHPATPDYAATLAFMTLAFAQVFHLGNARSAESVLRPTRIVANRYALGAVALVLVLQTIAVSWAPLVRILGLAALGSRDWLVVGALGVLPGVAGQIAHALRSRSSASP
jgi:Ca2+-transporting ATPase